PFIAALRANMRHAGVLRIDHVMALQRLYWIPAGSPATEGAYLTYPLRDLLRLVALESHRQRCAVIGEDLGTVPEGFREAMRAANVLSYRVLAFERRGLGGDARPGDAQGVLARPRHRMEGAAQPLSRRRGGRPRGRGTAPRPRDAAGRARRRGADRARARRRMAAARRPAGLYRRARRRGPPLSRADARAADAGAARRRRRRRRAGQPARHHRRASELVPAHGGAPRRPARRPGAGAR